MSQPPTYNRQFSFSDWQGSNPADPLPSAQHEIELNAIKVTLDAILGNLALIQRDDGRLANLSVGADQLEVSLRLGVNPPTAWAASTAYVVNDTVVYNVGARSELWLALTAHTSTSNFDTDSLTSGYWRLLADFATIALDASATVFDNTVSGLTATNVQDAIDEIDAALDAFVVPDADYGDITVSGGVWSLDAGVVDATAIAAGTITATELATGAVGTAELAALSVTTAKIAALAVTTAKIAALAVTSAELASSAVTTAKLADNAVTLAKMEHGTSGDILYYGAGGAPFRLAKGADGEALKLAAGLPAWGAPSSVNRGTPVATTSGSTHTIPGVLAGANLLLAVFDEVSLTGTAVPLLQLGDSGGIETTGYTGTSGDAGDIVTSATTGFLLGGGGGAAQVMSGGVLLARINSNVWSVFGVVKLSASKIHMVAGRKSLSGELTQVRLANNGADTFDAGLFNVLDL